MEAILILGAGAMQVPAIRRAKEKGLCVYAVDANPHAVGVGEVHYFSPIDLKETKALIEYAKTIPHLTAVFTAATDFSHTVSCIAEALGLQGHSVKSSLNATDKALMRECFKKAGIAHPAWTCYQFKSSLEYAEIEALCEKEKNRYFPCVVKPADNMGARGCQLVYHYAELIPAMRSAVFFSKSNRCIVEDYISGPEFSIEGLVYDGAVHITTIADRHIYFAPYFVEMGHTIPSKYDPKILEEVADTFKRGVIALGLSHGAVKGDIFFHKGRAVIGEIAARLSGGYMSGWTVPYALNYDITSAAIDLACARKLPAVPTFKQVLEPPYASAERAWISIPGVVESVSGISQSQATLGVKNVILRAHPGDTVDFPHNNVEKCGNVISQAPARSQAIATSKAACKNIVLRLKAHNEHTEAFLRSWNTSTKTQADFPPNMMQVLPSIDIDNLSESLDTCSWHNHNGLIFPAFIKNGKDCIDLHGRTIDEALYLAMDIEPALRPILTSQTEDLIALRQLWKVFFRASVQGLLYYFDTYLREK